MITDAAFHQAISKWNQALHSTLGAAAFVGDSQLIGVASWQMRFAEYIWAAAVKTQPHERGERNTNMTTGIDVLGHMVRDVITQLEGIATGHVTYISGCNQVLVAPHGFDRDGSPRGSRWFDEQRLEVIEGEKIVLDNTKTPGPDQEPPKR